MVINEAQAMIGDIITRRIYDKRLQKIRGSRGLCELWKRIRSVDGGSEAQMSVIKIIDFDARVSIL